MRKFLKRAVVVGTAVAVTGLGAGAAYAFVTTSGTGNSSQAATSAANYTLAVTVSPTSNLTPGAPQQVTVTVKNNGPAKVKLSTVTLVLPSSVTGVDSAAWGTVTVTSPTVQSGGVVLDKGQTSAPFTGSIQIEDSATVDQTSLLDKTFTLTANVS